MSRTFANYMARTKEWGNKQGCHWSIERRYIVCLLNCGNTWRGVCGNNHVDGGSTRKSRSKISEGENNSK